MYQNKVFTSVKMQTLLINIAMEWGIEFQTESSCGEIYASTILF